MAETSDKWCLGPLKSLHWLKQLGPGLKKYLVFCFSHIMFTKGGINYSFPSLWVLCVPEKVAKLLLSILSMFSQTESTRLPTAAWLLCMVFITPRGIKRLPPSCQWDTMLSTDTVTFLVPGSIFCWLHLFSHRSSQQMPFSLSLALHPSQHELFIWQISLTLFKD